MSREWRDENKSKMFNCHKKNIYQLRCLFSQNKMEPFASAETEGDVQYEHVTLGPDMIASIKAMTTLQVAKMCGAVFHPAWQKEPNHFTRCVMLLQWIELQKENFDFIQDAEGTPRYNRGSPPIHLDKLIRLAIMGTRDILKSNTEEETAKPKGNNKKKKGKNNSKKKNKPKFSECVAFEDVAPNLILRRNEYFVEPKHVDSLVKQELVRIGNAELSVFSCRKFVGPAERLLRGTNYHRRVMQNKGHKVIDRETIAAMTVFIAAESAGLPTGRGFTVDKGDTTLFSQQSMSSPYLFVLFEKAESLLDDCKDGHF